MDIDKVAKALTGLAIDPVPDRGTYRLTHEDALNVAQAAIDALGLRKETANRPVLAYDDPPTRKDNRMVQGPDGFWATHFEFVPSFRLVSEWYPHVEHADSMRPWVEEQR